MEGKISNFKNNDINLYFFKNEINRKKAVFSRDLFILFLTIMINISILGCYSLIKFNELNSVKTNIGKYEEKVSSYKDLMAFKEGYEKEMKSLNEKLTIASFDVPTDKKYILIEELDNLLTEEIFISRILIENGNLTLTGHTDNNKCIEDIVKKLDNNKKFKDVSSVRVNRDQATGELEMTLKINWRD